MRAIILLIAALCCASPALADSLLVVMSTKNSVSDAALAGFQSACKMDSQTLVLSDYAEVDLPRIVREEQPDLILTIGESAYKAARKIRNVPVVAMLSLSLSADKKNPANVTGVDLRIKPDPYMKVFAALGAKRIGVVYTAGQNGAYLQTARTAAEQRGLTLVLHPADSPQDALRKLAELKGQVDGLWLIPDSAVLATPAQEAFFNFSLAQKKPLVGYSRENLKQGATAALAVDWRQMGRQAGEEADRLMKGATPKEVPAQTPRNFALLKNDNVLKVLGFRPSVLDNLFPTPN